MTREELQEQVLVSTAKDYIFQLATGVGKTKLCLDKIANLYPNIAPKILIVVPYKNLIGDAKSDKGWYAEFIKWGYKKYLQNVTFSCYASLQKHAGQWDCVVLDEAHHTSERCQDLLKAFKIGHLFVLSATLSREHKWFFNNQYPNIKEFNVNIHNAIDEGILPEPRIILIPLTLDNKKVMEIVYKNPKKALRNPITIDFRDRFTYSKYPGKVTMRCTAAQYSAYLDGLIDWASKNGRKMVAAQQGGNRLKFLAAQKLNTVKLILKHLDKQRTLTFCGSIANAISLGYPRIDSKIGLKYLDEFNAQKIDHLSCVEMLDEGANLTNCKIGIFQMINTSSRMAIQRSGRIYRHKEPILIFPYFVNSKEEQTVSEIISGYKEYLIEKVNNINGIHI